MELTKYEHACFTVEKGGQIVVVDPGNFTNDFTAPEQVAAIVITHKHADHFDPDLLAAIYDKNPDALLLADQAVIDKAPAHKSQAVRAGDKVSVGEFDLEFFGGTHAQIHPTMPAVPNVGVLINDLLYYPGDSFALPKRPIDTLAIPAAAPWLKIGEAIDFLTAIHPRFAFPTHDAISSDLGKQLSDAMLGQTAKAADIDYQRLHAPIKID